MNTVAVRETVLYDRLHITIHKRGGTVPAAHLRSRDSLLVN
jgi:hypothetical protein